MIVSKKWNIRSALFSIFAGLMMALALWGGPPTLALGEGRLRVRIPHQTAMVLDGGGNLLGLGVVNVHLVAQDDGRASGRVEVTANEFEYRMSVRTATQILDVNGNISGVSISGELMTPEGPIEAEGRVEPSPTSGLTLTISGSTSSFAGLIVTGVAGEVESREQ